MTLPLSPNIGGEKLQTRWLASVSNVSVLNLRKMDQNHVLCYLILRPEIGDEE